ncbi:alpha/beta hydrolase [Pseudomaricurvus alkylphenolicus]|uniref:alpha/beta hydrolase n=1 Tax=Pseudomaricurvus alkylphenolicus TaxID=1306991 RepID=UPI0014208775|nr:alpha/beta hydrolase [Pseudomaricurvus alkylphenolicus]NIB40284.1 alpha/beta hydrolase [Pseudomaricurvus alkylphenolicus]
MTYHYDPDIATIVDLFPFTDFSDPVEIRRATAYIAKEYMAEVDTNAVEFEDIYIPALDTAPDIRVRVYRPKQQESDVPGLLYIHGGGFAVGDLDQEHSGCVRIVEELGVVVISVDYRLAPEHPYPAPLEDCYSSLVWLAENAGSLKVDIERIGIMGASAGGGLAAGTTLMARDLGGPTLCFQFLGFPELDDRLETKSMKRFVDTPGWNLPSAVNSWKFYLGDKLQPGGDAVPYYAAPGRAKDLSNLPPTYVSALEFDPLRDEAIIYALRMLEAGVSVELHTYPGAFHGSGFLAPHAEVHVREMRDTLAALKRGLKADHSK